MDVKVPAGGPGDKRTQLRGSDPCLWRCIGTGRRHYEHTKIGPCIPKMRRQSQHQQKPG